MSCQASLRWMLNAAETAETALVPGHLSSMREAKAARAKLTASMVSASKRLEGGEMGRECGKALMIRNILFPVSFQKRYLK